MSATHAKPEPVERVSLDDLKHRAETVKDLVVNDTKEAVSRIVSDDATRTLLVVAGVVVVAASIAFLLGSRSSRRSFLGNLD